MNDNGNGRLPAGKPGSVIPATTGELVERIEAGMRMLARYRANNDEARGELIRLIKEMEASAEYQNWSARKAEAEREAAIAERLIREDVAAYYELTGHKPEVRGIGTRTKTNLIYDDAMALAWCQLFFEDALALNRDLFEKHARAVAETNPIPFVEITKEVIGTIGQDLSGWLTGKETQYTENTEHTEYAEEELS